MDTVVQKVYPLSTLPVTVQLHRSNVDGHELQAGDLTQDDELDFTSPTVRPGDPVAILVGGLAEQRIWEFRWVRKDLVRNGTT